MIKKTRIYNGGKDNLFKTWCCENWTATCKGIKLNYFHTPYMKTNSKWIKDLNGGLETIKLLQENIVYSLTSVLAIFGGGMSPLARETKAKINK